MRIKAGMAAIMLAAALAGCSRVPERDPNAWEVTVYPNGKLETRPGVADAPMPGGLPVYPNVRPGSRREMRLTFEDGRTEYEVEVETPHRPEQIFAFYRAEAERAGMRFVSLEEPELAQTMTVTRDGRLFDIVVFDMGDDRHSTIKVRERAEERRRGAGRG